MRRAVSWPETARVARKLRTLFRNALNSLLSQSSRSVMPILRECRRIMSSNRDSVRFPVTPPNLYTYTSFASRATLSARGKTWRLNNWSSAYLSPLGEGRADNRNSLLESLMHIFP